MSDVGGASATGLTDVSDTDIEMFQVLTNNMRIDSQKLNRAIAKKASRAARVEMIQETDEREKSQSPQMPTPPPRAEFEAANDYPHEENYQQHPHEDDQYLPQHEFAPDAPAFGGPRGWNNDEEFHPNEPRLQGFAPSDDWDGGRDGRARQHDNASDGGGSDRAPEGSVLDAMVATRLHGNTVPAPPAPAQRPSWSQPQEHQRSQQPPLQPRGPYPQQSSYEEQGGRRRTPDGPHPYGRGGDDGFRREEEGEDAMPPPQSRASRTPWASTGEGTSKSAERAAFESNVLQAEKNWLFTELQILQQTVPWLKATAVTNDMAIEDLESVYRRAYRWQRDQSSNEQSEDVFKMAMNSVEMALKNFGGIKKAHGLRRHMTKSMEKKFRLPLHAVGKQYFGSSEADPLSELSKCVFFAAAAFVSDKFSDPDDETVKSAAQSESAEPKPAKPRPKLDSAFD